MVARLFFNKKIISLLGIFVIFFGTFLYPQAAFAGDKKIGEQCVATLDCISGAGCQNNVCVADSFGTVDVGGSAGLGGGDIRATIAKIINISLSFLGVIAIGIVLYGGFMYMTAGGSDEKVGTAKKIMMNGVIGLAIVLASFAIARFVLSALSGSTGSGSVSSDDPANSACTDPSGICVIPVAGSPTACVKDFFIAESITPNQDKTGMNHVVIRALFSGSVASPLEDVFLITASDGKQIPKGAFSYAFAAGSNNRIVEAVYTAADGVCAAATDKNCLPINKKYNIALSPTIKDASGKTLQNEEAGQKCGGGFADILKNGASFTVDKNQNDAEKPGIEAALVVNGQETKDPKVKLPVGKSYAFNFSAGDNSGIAYIHVEMTSTAQDGKIIDAWYGPIDKSDVTFKKEIPFTLGSSVKPETEYLIKITAQDIDHKSSSLGLVFTAIGPTCGDGKMNGDETAVDTGGSCGGGNGASCQTAAQCATGHQCINNVCTPAPYIITVSPIDGASGNWITIAGKNFGDKGGKVEFGVTDGNDKPFQIKDTNWFPATIVDCQGTKSWKDSAIIVQVPEDIGAFTVGSKNAIRVTRVDGKEDTTINNVGYIPLPDGRFTKNTTKRPGLCNVTSKAGLSQALPKEPVHALGNGFGSKKDVILFGDIPAQVIVTGNSPHWSDVNIEVKVPTAIVPGSTPVQVQVGSEKSNPFFFTVIPENEASSIPVISSIDPTSTTPKSYITINGTGFGENGIVYLANQKSLSCPGAGCVPAISSLQQACGDTWKPKQVIVQVPDEATLPSGKTYYVVLVNTDNKLSTAGQESIKVEAGSPLPSICALSPSNGPAPLPTDHAGISIIGSNFTTEPTVYFYKKGADQNDVTGWFSSAKYSVIKKDKSSDVAIVTMLPVEGGSSMSTGPIKVLANGKLSNSILYEVQDCNAAGSQTPGADYQCCTASGPDKGLWKLKEQICQGDARVGGYVWRFTTGIFPEIPKVKEYCEKDASPSPWISQGLGGNACVNAEITVNFTVGMDTATLKAENIKLVNCGNGEKADCKDKYEAINITPKSNNRFEASAAAGDFAVNTWYRVELSSAITSLKNTTVAGKATVLKEPLLATRPCGGNTAYCFEFKTGQGQCEIKDVGVHPKMHKTNILGVVQDPSWPLDNLIDKPQHPLVFGTWAAADQACIMLDTDKLAWSWSAKTAQATVSALVTSSLAHAKALEHYPNGVELNAATTHKSKILTATSSLIIDLLEPKAVDFEPNCAESCVNPRIRVGFNRQMSIGTYSAGFTVYKCPDVNCVVTAKDKIPTKIDAAQSTMTELVAYADPNLAPATYYKVELTDAIRAVTGFKMVGDAKVDVLGKGISPNFAWVFKTQNNATACSVNSVTVSPSPFTANSIGQKVQYSATPFSSPNACSKFGQALNKWDYKYSWKSLDTDVASVSDFPNVSLGTINPACSIACLPRGSDITVTETTSENKALCGNSILDPGEDCDVNIDGKSACTAKCLRPGNSNTTTCGNGILETNLGEFCDPKLDGPEFCSKECLPLGSSAFDATKVGASVCGDGKVTKGEACDIGNNTQNNQGKILCTNSCLHKGTFMSAYYCKINPYFAIDECKSAVSICGNEMLEPEEECEYKEGGIRVRVGTNTYLLPKESKMTCSNNCRIQNACDLTIEQLAGSNNLDGLYCAKGSEGCTSDCRKAGSSPLYSSPSLCGDGLSATDKKAGIGEYAYCESTDGKSNASQSSPVQVVTAVGKKKPATNTQKTDIQVSLIATSTFTATSTFMLQCGYTEYVTPKVVAGTPTFNDCPDALQGVSGTSSCCLPRPVRQAEYPINGAGFAGTTAACPNTLITATFSAELKEDTLAKNVLIARGYTEANYNCSSTIATSLNVTQDVQKIAYGSIETPGFLKKLWAGVKTFFAKMLGMDVIAEENPYSKDLADFKTWCTTGEALSITGITYPPTAAGAATTTMVTIGIDKPLASLSTYTVLLHGGKQGILDIDGVGIRNPYNNKTLDDMWLFKTKKDLCKISTVTVQPDKFTFVSPSQTQEFLAVAKTKDNEFIQSTNAYAWNWEWHPSENPVFYIPAPNTSTGTPAIIIQPKGPQGKLSAVASAKVTVDSSEGSLHVGQSFSGVTNLTAAFCENPWPGHVDSMFNFNFEYCPDAGKTGNKNDDLAYLSAVNVANKSIITKKCLVGGTQGTEKACATDVDCAKILNFPFDDIGKQECDTSDASLLSKISCTLYDMSAYSGYCKLDDQYPPQYGLPYIGCETDSNCRAWGENNSKKEKCVPLPLSNTPAWKVTGNSCIEIKTEEKSKSISQNTLKKILFTSDKSSDAIGLQIFENPKRLSAQQWFAQEFGGAGKIQSVNIAGYDGVTDGASYYINALNIDKQTNQVFNNIYLFSINADAQSDTKVVFDKILGSLAFNTNLSDYGYCGTGAKTDFQSFGGVACKTDFDCQTPLGAPLASTNGVCSNEKTKFLRDWKRLGDVKKIQDSLADYKATKGTYPELKSGTFIPGYSVSKWSSWGALGAELGGLPVDPINKWSQCNGQDQETCWNPTASTFSCPTETSVYEYAYSSATKQYTLHVPFEYFKIGSLKLEEFIPNQQLVFAEPSCKPNIVYSAFVGGSCGDGIVQPGEQCDPVGKKLVTADACPANQIKELVCNTSCKWDASACKATNVCGNGKVEAGESCDDGASNGKYGYCNFQCTGFDATAGFCGNGKIDFDDKNKNGTKEAGENDIEQCDGGPTGKWAMKVGDSCSASCTKSGPHCGDGVVQSGTSEQCDDKNNTSLDGCSATCLEENIACLKAGPTYVLPNPPATADVTAFSLTKSQPVEHITQCMSNTTGNAICLGAGLVCNSLDRIEKTTKIKTTVPCGVQFTSEMTTYPASGYEYILYCGGTYKPTEKTLPTVEKLICGNGTLEKEIGEVCDEGAKNGLQCSPEYGKSCTYCSNDCKKVLTVDTLAFCGNGKLDAGEACDFEGTIENQTKVIAMSTTTLFVSGNFIPFYGENEQKCADLGAYKCTASCTYVQNNCVSCSVQKDKPVPKLAIITPMTTAPNSPFSNVEYVELTRPTTTKYIGYRKINYDKHDPVYSNIYSNFKDGYVSPFVSQYLIVDDVSKPMLSSGIETDLLCKAEYKLFFNPTYRNPSYPAVTSSVKNTAGDYFPYPVNGEPAIVSNEVIMSPAVPPSTYRVVVKWTSAEKGINFLGAVYKGNSFTLYSDAYPVGSNGINHCRKIVTSTEGYWVPDPKDCTPYKLGIYMHPIINTEKTYVQSYTLDMNKMSDSAQPLAFVVHTDSGPIYPYRFNGNVKVEVYEYHKDQVPAYSIYLPTNEFLISKAGNTTSNQSAKYWHVFNIVKENSAFTIKPVEQIETTECQVAENIPAPATLSDACKKAPQT